MCEWVKRSWDDIRPEIIVKPIKKCGISNALDDTENDKELLVAGFQDDEDDDEDFSCFEDD